DPASELLITTRVAPRTASVDADLHYRVRGGLISSDPTITSTVVASKIMCSIARSHVVSPAAAIRLALNTQARARAATKMMCLQMPRPQRFLPPAARRLSESP